MIYLILAFCSSALISIVMRYGEGRIQNNISALAVNYSICLLLSLIYSAGSGSFAVSQDSAKSVLPNYYSARFLLLSLSEVPAVAAFPTFSIGTILLTGAAGVALFGEKMTKRQWIAIGIVIAAMVLLNI